jgi:hypothetical protein
VSDEVRMNKLVREAVEALRSGQRATAKWLAVLAAGEMVRLDAPFPADFAAEPLKGWAEYGADLARRGCARPVPGPAAGWQPRPGLTHAAHCAGTDE